MSIPLLASLLLSALCSSTGDPTGRPTGHPPQNEPEWAPILVDGEVQASLHGTWRSRGYGWIAQLGPRSFQMFDHGPYGTRRLDDDFEELVSWIGHYKREGEALLVGTGKPNSTFYWFDPVQPDEIGFSPDPPAPPADALSVFDYLWSVMDTHYAFFDLYDVDWAERRRRLRPLLTPDSSEAELFDCLAQLLHGLRDGHLTLTADVDGQTRSVSEGDARVLGPALRRAFEAQDEVAELADFERRWRHAYHLGITETLLFGDFEMAAEGRLVWGRMGEIGYVTIRAMGGFAASEDLRLEVAATHRLFARIIGDLADCAGLVVDVTMNTGGYDEVQLAIAAHFTDVPRLAFTKFPADTDGVPPQPFYVVPAEEGRYLGPVALVTSDFTVSAGEDFTLAMRNLPNVTHYGMPTAGAFSDLLSKRLPNGWSLTLSNEVYLDAEGVHWEARGITPEVAVPVFDPTSIEDSHTRAIFAIADEMYGQGD